MTGIVLSASVRQNLLSLQSTASLLATTQNNLATGNKVNSALDNPTNFFTSQALNNRASDIGNLLDSIGNGVQVLEAANTGITSLQKLVENAQSIANQVLQTPTGYSAKSSISATLAGATASNLLTASAGTDAVFTAGLQGSSTSTTAFTSTTSTGTVALVDSQATPAAVTAATSLDSTAGNHLASAVLTALSGQTLTVNGNTITFSAAATATTTVGSNTTIGLGAGTSSTFGDILTAITNAAGNGTSDAVTGAGKITLTTGTSNNITITGGAAATALGIATTTRGGGVQSAGTFGATTVLGSPTAGAAGALSHGFSVGDTITVNNQALTFVASGASGNNQINVTDNVTTLLAKIDALSGNSGTASSISAGGVITLHTGTQGPLTVTSNNLTAFDSLGFSGTVNQALTPGASLLAGLTLNIAATTGGTASNIVFGSGAGQVSTLNQLNSALQSNNLQASLDSTGKLTINTTNDAASQTIGAVSGSATQAGKPLAGLSVAANAPVVDSTVQSARAGLVSQYNNILQQINTTAQDSSFNGVNLLNGDTLKLVFNETGKSTLSITGTTFNDAGLGLTNLTQGSDFLDNSSANAVLNSLGAAASTLRSEASTLGSNLSVVQIRQDFNKNLINVLQTGASSLTLADPNEEAANSQALSTRQSIAVSALALANQSQQSVLQLLR
jgi:flagellin